MSNKTFNSVQAIRPGMSVFDLSYTKTFTCDMGQLIPIMADEMVPGDIFKIGNQSVIRFQPLVAPILHEINAYVHYFFVLIVFSGQIGRHSSLVALMDWMFLPLLLLLQRLSQWVLLMTISDSLPA